MVLVVISLLAAPIVLASPDAEAAVCPGGLQTMEDVGLVCPQDNGLVEVFAPGTLQSLGYIHGGDPIPAGDEVYDDVGALGGTNVNCVSGAAGTYYIQVIYARATNDADGYATWLPSIRWQVGQANKLVDDAGIATGSPASLNVKCVGGLVEVKNEVLPTAMASASFSTIKTDLFNKGYTDTKVKYWVFYDDTGACSCGGQGNIYGDDTLAASNLNNGNAGSTMVAINYGYNSTRVMLHELGHNMGAVQNNAPYTSGGYHCNDGRDTMCYADGGSNSSYSTAFCAVEVWDCNKNTYFHTNPPAGSYLATKWNLGSTLNRFIQFGIPTLTTLTCPTSAETGQSITCTFVATDDSSGVKYTVTWGDGTTTLVPTSGYVTPGVTQSASKTYTTAGTRTITVSVADSAGFTGNSLSRSISIVVDTPAMNLLTCTSPVELGTATSCSLRATDQSSGVKYTVSWGDGTTTLVPTSGYVTPGVTQTTSKTYGSSGTRTVSVTPTDIYGHIGAALTTSVNVVYDLTPPTLTVSDPHGGTIYYGCTVEAPNPAPSARGLWVDTACVRALASDAKSGMNRVEVWVSGSLRATDFTSPYTLEFPVPGTATNTGVTVKAYDNAGNMRQVIVPVDMIG